LWDLFVAADGFSENGIHIFNTEDNVESFFPPPSFSTYMKFHRFKLWKQFIVKVNEDGARKRDGDPWWQFAAAIDGFNDVRLNKITTSLLDIMDDSMSSYVRERLPQVHYQTYLLFSGSRSHLGRSSNVPHVQSLAL
jgi:hypothetical protein